MAEPLGLPETADQPKQVEAVRRALEGMEGWLLVFDNVEDPAAVQRDYFPRRGNGRVLLTSRRTDWRGIAKALPLDVLPEADAVALLSGGAEARAGERAEAAALARELGYLPLALAQAHAYIAEHGPILRRLPGAPRRAPRGPPPARRAERLQAAGAAHLGAFARGGRDRHAPRRGRCWSCSPSSRPTRCRARCSRPTPRRCPSPCATRWPATMPSPRSPASASSPPRQGTLAVHRLVQAVVRDRLAPDLAAARAECAVRLAAAGLARHRLGPQGLVRGPGPAAARPGGGPGCRGARPTVAITAYVLDRAATYLQTRGAYAEAEPLFKRALAIGEKALGPDHPDVATSLNNLAVLYRATGRYAEAEPLYQRALAIGEKALGPEHPDVATRLNNLAVLYQATGRYAEAEPLYQRALAIGEKALGPDHPDVATALNNLAVLYQATAATPRPSRSTSAPSPSARRRSAPTTPTSPPSLNNLAELYRATGRYAEAEPLYRARPRHPREGARPRPPRRRHIASTTWPCSTEATGRYAEAEPLYQRALAIGEKALGPEHPDVATSLNNLAVLYQATGRYAEAEPLYQRALAILEKACRRTIRTWRQSARTTPLSSTSSAAATRPPRSGPGLPRSGSGVSSRYHPLGRARRPAELRMSASRWQASSPLQSSTGSSRDRRG